MPTATRREPLIGAELERLRLARRARRVERVLTELRARRRVVVERREVPPPALSLAIADFARELADARRRLAAR
jgi:hypothetical protein